MKDILLVAGLMVLPSSVSFRQQNATASINAGDPRLRRLEEFFAKRDCPLRAAAADFLIAADQNALDWRLLPSISMVESSGGRIIGTITFLDGIPAETASRRFARAFILLRRNWPNPNATVTRVWI